MRIAQSLKDVTAEQELDTLLGSARVRLHRKRLQNTFHSIKTKLFSAFDQNHSKFASGPPWNWSSGKRPKIRKSACQVFYSAPSMGPLQRDPPLRSERIWSVRPSSFEIENEKACTWCNRLDLSLMIRFSWCHRRFWYVCWIFWSLYRIFRFLYQIFLVLCQIFLVTCTILGSALLPSLNSSIVSRSSWN